MQIEKKGSFKVVRSESYNYIFNLVNGFFARWGKTKLEDPQFSPFGPELLDIEISTICSSGCDWCYKSNTSNGKNMNLLTFKAIFNKIPKNLTQIAFGIGDIDANPEIWKIFEYCRDNYVIPNVTINGYKIDENFAKKLVKYCGAVAVSHYDNEHCFNAIKLLTDRGTTQVNIHKLLAIETLDSCYNLIDQTRRDSRLQKLNAIVFLSLKRKGRGINFHKISKKEFLNLVKYAFKRKVLIGFDSCSAHKFFHSIKDQPRRELIEMMIEPCDSSCFSLYINVEGKTYPCSFLEGEIGYNGIDVLKTKNFLNDVWNNDSIKSFRNKLIAIKRICPHFKI